MSNTSLSFIRSLKFKILFLASAGMLVMLVTVCVYVLPLYEKNFVESQKEEIRAATDVAYGIIENYAKQADDKVLSKAEAQTRAKDLIRKLRFNGTDYFFISDLDGVILAHGNDSSIEGLDRTGIQDAVNGKLFFKEMRDVARDHGQGFVQYHYGKTKGGPPVAKMVYVRAFKGWGWYVATGLYQDVIFAKVHDFEINILSGFLVVFVLSGALSVWFSLLLTSKIKNLVMELSAHSSQVLHSIQLVSAAGEDLSGSSNEAAVSLEQTVDLLGQVSGMIRANSENAQQAAAISQESRQAAEQGEKELGHLHEAMKDISSSSNKIEEIINVIDDISFQTNLLALNAAVEAARAGEQGKGFAVVADAVRSLAQRSSAAAKDISHLIKESVEKIEHGSKAASHSGDVLQNIMNGVKKIADLNVKIASASKDQTRGIEQIGQAMSQLGQISQSNATSSEHISLNVIEISGHIGAVDEKVHELGAIVDGRLSAHQLAS